MRRYSRFSAANWSWPPLFFNEKPLFPPISHRKNAYKIFWYWCRKRRTPSDNQISQKEKQKTLRCFLFQNGDYRTPKSCRTKIVDQSGKIKFHTENGHSVPSSSTVFVGVKIVRQLCLHFFLLWTHTFCLFRCIDFFHIFPYRNLTVWFFNCCHFRVISILFVCYWVPMEATFS